MPTFGFDFAGSRNVVGKTIFPRMYPSTSAGAAGVSQLCYAAYCGAAPERITTCRISVVIGATAAAGVTWAEVAIASGDHEPNVGLTAGTPNLTTLGFGSIATEVAAGTNRTASVIVTPTTPIPTDTEIWLLVSVNATTQPAWRIFGDDDAGVIAQLAATRPSTMTPGTAFTASTIAAQLACPRISCRILS